MSVGRLWPAKPTSLKRRHDVPRYLIERTLPGAGDLSQQQLHDISAKSNAVFSDMQRNGTPMHWIESFVTGNSLQCVYVAPNAEAVREHARLGGFPCDRVTEVIEVIDPTTGE
jgi:hypothetical protein